MEFKDDTQQLRQLPAGAVAQALSLAHDQAAQRAKGGAGYLYFLTPSGELVTCRSHGKADGAPVWRVGADRWTDSLGLVQQLRQLPTIGHAKAALRRAAGLVSHFSPLPCLTPYPAAERRSCGPDAAPTPPTLLPAPGWAAAWLRQRGLALPADAAGVRSAGSNITNLAFPHRDAAGAVVGVEVRGRNRRFKGFSGRKSMFILPPDGDSRVLCVVESAIDALALREFLRARSKTALIVSTAGRAGGDYQLNQISDLAARRGVTKIVAAQDRDQAGDDQAAVIQRLADSLSVGYARMLPPAGCKDWADWTERRGSAA